MAELVSILIPAYNAAKWIQQAIDSALAQTWRRNEVIVVDDGSTDCTLDIARSYNSPAVLVMSQENRGASAARNLALSRAQGDYIQWLDADDLLAPDKIAGQMARAEAGQSSLVLLSGAWGTFYYYPGRSRFCPTSLWEDLTPSEWLFRKIAHNDWMANMSWLVSRRLTEIVGAWNESLTLDDDGEYFCRIVMASGEIRFIPEATCFYRIGNTYNLSNRLTYDCDKLQSLFKSTRFQIESLIAKEDSPRTRACCIGLLQRWAACFQEHAPEDYKQLKQLAGDLGGQIVDPVVNKMRIVSKIFGPANARKIQHTVRRLRTSHARVSEMLRFHVKSSR